MKVLDAVTEENQKRKEEKKIEKLKNPIQLSRYKYQPQELELKVGYGRIYYTSEFFPLPPSLPEK